MAPLDLTMTQLISKISELHNDITCQINLDPPADIVSPYQLGLHQQQQQDVHTTLEYLGY